MKTTLKNLWKRYIQRRREKGYKDFTGVKVS